MKIVGPVAHLVLITVVLAAAAMTHAASDSPSTETAAPAPATESSTTGNAQPIERQFKGPLDPIGPFSWVDLDGRRWTDRDFRGKVLIVQQWAAWCGPCIDEFPEVQKLYDRVHHDPSIVFVSFDMDRDPRAISEFLHEFRAEYSFPVLFAGAELKLKSIPRTWIVDRDGYIRESFGNVGTDLVEKALALGEEVKRKPPVSSLPPDAREAARKRNAEDGLSSR